MYPASTFVVLLEHEVTVHDLFVWHEFRMQTCSDYWLKHTLPTLGKYL